MSTLSRIAPRQIIFVDNYEDSPPNSPGEFGVVNVENLSRTLLRRQSPIERLVNRQDTAEIIDSEGAGGPTVKWHGAGESSRQPKMVMWRIAARKRKLGEGATVYVYNSAAESSLGQWLMFTDGQGDVRVLGASSRDPIETELAWLRLAESVERRGDVDGALDIIYDHINDLCIGGHFDLVNRLLEHTFVHLLQTDLLLGILTASRSYRGHLPARKALCENARDILIERGEDAGSVLKYIDI